MSTMSLSCWPHVHKEYLELDEPDSGGTSFETGTLPAREDSFLYLVELPERDPQDP